MNTDQPAESGVRPPPLRKKPFSLGRPFVATTVFACLLGVVSRFGHGIWIRAAVVVLPAVVLPPYLILRPYRRPWQFSIRPLLLLTTVYAILLSAAATSRMMFFLALYHLEIIWIVCFYPFVLLKRGWYGCFFVLLGAAGFAVSLAVMVFLFLALGMSGGGPAASAAAQQTSIWGWSAVIAMIVSLLAVACGAGWQLRIIIERRRKDGRGDRGK